MGLIVKDVNKSFGTKKVVDSIHFEIQKPGIYGLLGTNGAGKTTTLRMLLGILKKDSGEITWNGKEVQRKHVNFGYLPEERGVYPKTKIHDQLMYFARLKGMSKTKAEENLVYWAKKLEVEQYLQMTPEKLSKGNQQKVQFITAILHDPELLILDEPFSGLDPVNTQLLKDVIIELIQKGTYIIMSSHQMHSVEEFASDVLILNKGKTVLQGNLKQIKQTYAANKLSLSTKQDVEHIIKQVGLEIYHSKNNEYIINISGEEEGYQLFDELSKNHIQVEKFEIMKPSLHDIFIEKVGE